ncbi:molecular chaperone TorD [Thalassotalea atypica]|uniref:molecular chaperone TorD n=1 Tax=Thalassotalea atypica TaxID=2054316 RepID=UPI00257454CE|nr:molecular chaperone TorD [Thalassotalea atypica]
MTKSRTVNQGATQETAADLAKESQARAIVYNFLSSLFAKEVTSDLVMQLSSEQGQSFLASLALEPSLSASISEINTKLASLNSEQAVLELAADFCGLFLVDGRTSVSPYAGQYFSSKTNDAVSNQPSSRKKKDRVELFGELHQRMISFLTDNKLQIHNDFPEPGDHIAIILAYIGHLCNTAGRKEQLDFIEHYLMTWLGDFVSQVNKHDNGSFYNAVAELTLQWLKFDIINLK